MTGNFRSLLDIPSLHPKELLKRSQVALFFPSATRGSNSCSDTLNANTLTITSQRGYQQFEIYIHLYIYLEQTLFIVRIMWMSGATCVLVH
jgi:hypothetical protein